MGNRMIERSMARSLYVEFSRRWRREKNLAGLHGKPGYRKPTFNQWFARHREELAAEQQQLAQHIQERPDVDPWADDPVEETDRGVVEIPMVGGENE